MACRQVCGECNVVCMSNDDAHDCNSWDKHAPECSWYKETAPSLTELQAQVGAWAEHNFPTMTADDCFLGVVEEVGEHAHHILKRKMGIRGTAVEHEAQQKDAVADTVIFLLHLCHRRGWDMERLLLETWARVRERDWVKFPKDGVSE